MGMAAPGRILRNLRDFFRAPRTVNHRPCTAKLHHRALECGSAAPAFPTVRPGRRTNSPDKAAALLPHSTELRSRTICKTLQLGKAVGCKLSAHSQPPLQPPLRLAHRPPVLRFPFLSRNPFDPLSFTANCKPALSRPERSERVSLVSELGGNGPQPRPSAVSSFPLCDDLAA